MAQSLWIPYLTDNIYRLTGLGTHADITQLRQAVRKIDSGQQVGIKPLVPFSKLLGDAELANLPNILQQVSSDPVKHLCHKLMWFPTLNVDNSQNQDTNEIRATIQSTYSRSRVEYFHSIFILELLQFLASGKETHLKNCIEKLSSFYNHQKFEGYVRLLVEQIRQGTLSNFADVLEEAQAAVASSILEFAVDTSLEALSTGDFDRGRSLLKLVVESPLDDDWEDAALTRVNQHVSPILSTIREITRQTDSWSPQFKDPISQEYAQVEALADLLRGRVLAVREWDLILQQWTDKKAILMCNYAVESVNEFATVIERANLTLRHHSPQMIQELRKRLENAEKVIQQALQTKVSEQTRQHLNKMLNETHELITRIPPTPANAQDIHTRNHDTILNPRKSNVSKAFPSGGRFINTADRWKAKQRGKTHHKRVNHQPSPLTSADDKKIPVSEIAGLVIDIWRMTKRANTNSVPEPFLIALERTVERLQGLGFEIREYEGEDYHPNMSVIVVDNLGGEPLKIVECLTPAVYYGGKLVERANVVIGGKSHE
jgi:hypothetical protein